MTSHVTSMRLESVRKKIFFRDSQDFSRLYLHFFEGIIFDQPLNPNRIMSIRDQRDFEPITKRTLKSWREFRERQRDFAQATTTPMQA